MARVAFDNVQIDALPSLFEIGQTESADAVRRQYAVQRAEVANDNVDIVSTQVDILRSRFNDPENGVAALAERVETNFTSIQGARDDLSVQSGQLVEITADITDLNSEINSRATIVQLQDAQADNASARAQLSTTLRSEFDGDIAALDQSLSTEIDSVTGKIESMYAVRLQVDNDGTRYIGGYGLSNDGTTVQAAFDVDLFSIGRLGAGKVQPFIVDTSDGNVYIDRAMIAVLNAGELSAITTKTGTLQVDRLTTAAPNSTAGRVELSGQGSYALWGGSGSKTSGNAKWYVDQAGNFVGRDITARGDVEATSVKAGTVNIIDELMIQGNAVVVPIGYKSDAKTNQAGDVWAEVARINVPAGKLRSATPAFVSFGFNYEFEVWGTGNASVGVRLLINGSIEYEYIIEKILVTNSNSSSLVPINRSGAYNFGRQITLGTSAATVALEAEFYTTNNVDNGERATFNRYMFMQALKNSAGM
ncbi:DUF1983 domain-containing protein [Salinisphaera sp. T31B1]|uniref:phage tail tip fiber protein n=1 Tax=Salinisphaera sp. T31B1 TaxID=727963 RepID=UPI003342AA44